LWQAFKDQTARVSWVTSFEGSQVMAFSATDTNQ
jgi:hypothetical protein